MGIIIAVGILFLLLGIVLTKFAAGKKDGAVNNVGRFALVVGIVIIAIALGLIFTWVGLKVKLFAVEVAMKLFKYLAILAVIALVAFVINQAIAKKKQ